MRNLGLLIKNDFLIILGNLQGKKNRTSTLFASGILVVLLALIVACYTYTSNGIFLTMGVEMGLFNVCLFQGLSTGVTLILLLDVMRVSTTNSTSDADLLLSLPIKKRDIVLAKTISKYLFDLIFVIAFLVPYFVLYQVYTGFSVMFTVWSAFISLTLPLASVGLGYIFSFILSKLFNKYKFASLLKSLMVIIITVGAIVLLTTSANSASLATAQTLKEYFSSQPITYTLLKILINSSFTSVLIYIAMLLPLITIGLILYGVNFGKTLASYKSKNKELKFNKPKSSYANLLKKELLQYISCPAYLINTIVGPILMLIFPIVLLFAEEYAQIFELLAFAPHMVAGICALVLCCASSTTTITASSISLEAKQLWILKSTPIKPFKILTAKALLQMVVVTPAIIISGTLCTIILKLTLIDLAIILLLPIFANILYSYTGLLINLWLPNLDWDDEVKVVKQSMAVSITMLANIIISLLPVALYFILPNSSILSLAFVSAMLFSLLASLMLYLTKTVGVKLFNQL